ncbi:G2/mitotic-specific cyclin-B1 [Astathelohania contejeani]|uniref:G2/mitotic-specific cyclin-B1 n=1 Tax=Astathelohania contejeani TaxID=164912 RepID=A0ABQ7HZA5_9MICR|nr:G2/mitotic-specific cyclin-B1 [Thelohania contejeani]
MKRVFQEITNVMKKNIKITVHKTNQRKKLMRWMYEVATEFEYSQITYALAINITDRYVRIKGIDTTTYQLVGTTALFIAAKTEERNPKNTADYASVTDNAYTISQILEMERAILTTLNFQVSVILPHNFVKLEYLERISSESGIPIKECANIFFSLISYFLEKEECLGNVFGIYDQSKSEFEEIVLAKSRVENEDIKFYFNLNKEISI